MLFKRELLQPGEHVLIVGAGGGVNSLALSLCRSVGCTVYALTSGAEKVKRAEELGAQYVIDYSKVQNWHVEVLKLSRGRGVDVVVDNVGQATIAKSIRAAARGGRIVTVGNTSGHDIRFDNRLVFTKQLSILGSTMGSTQDFHDAMQYLWDNNIPIPIDRVDPLSKGIEMLQRLEEGKQFGKIVLTP